MGSGKKPIVGWRYYMGVHMGLSHGPVDAILEIQSGDRSAWKGMHTTSSRLKINAPKLFGGDKREGGLVGDCDVMMGEATQEPNAYLASKIAGPQPAYRGIFGLVYNGQVSANNPYVKAWKVCARRILKGWRDDDVWYPEKAAIDLGNGHKAMNAAHIIYECLTNDEWGMGYPTAAMSTASFTAAADAFYAEGFGLCLKWSQQDSIESFVQLVADHAGAIVTEDPTTGLFILRAVRNDYDPATLPEYSDTAGNVIELQNFERATGIEAPNEITVKYTDVTNGKTGSVTMQNLASIQGQGAVIPETRPYPGLPTAALALRVAQRDLQVTTSALARARLVLTRAAYGMAPGDVFRFSWGPLGVASMAMRVAKIDYGTITNGRITIEAVEDVFGLPATTYVNMPAVGWTPPDYTANPVTLYRLDEATYRDAVSIVQQANVDQLADTASFLVAAAARPAGIPYAFDLRTRVGTAAYASAGPEGAFCPGGKLAAPALKGTTTITLTEAIDLDLLTVGDAAFLGDEIVRVDAIDEAAAQVTIGRGCADTPPKDHPIGTAFLGFGYDMAHDATQYATGEKVDAKLVTRTGTDELDEATAPGGQVTMTGRIFKPYAPGKLRLNGAKSLIEALSPITVSWAHRNRTTQADKLIDTEASSVTPEAGTTYTARLLRTDTMAVVTQQTGVAGTSATLTSSYRGEVIIDVQSTRGGTTSRARLTSDPFMLNPTMRRITEASDVRTTEDGLDTRITE